MPTKVTKKRLTSKQAYGDRKKKKIRPTSAQARASGSNMVRRPKKTGTNRTVGNKVMKKSRPSY